jgi:two-component system phosphate regulon response regulator OmpR
MKNRVTIIDDDPDLRQLIAIALKAAGYQVGIRSDGADYISRNDALADLFIIDIDLGGVSGLDICRKLKEKAEGKVVPVVILISANPDLRVLAQEVCADDTLPKPFNAKQLTRKISEYLPIH